MKLLFTFSFFCLHTLIFTQTIVQWNFTDSNASADGGIAANLSSMISTTAAGTISYPVGTSGTINNPPYILSTAWANGANWEFTISTIGYSNLALSFKQRSSGTGPRDWSILVNGSTVSSHSLSGSTGQTFGPISLGQDADNSSSVTITFQVTSSTNVNGTTIAAGGTSGLDDILISGTILPVTFYSFDAVSKDNSTYLNFATETETNNDYFTIEKSTDGTNFIKIAEIKGAGNSTLKQAYEFKDESPFNGINYYRIKQTDFDGKFSYTEIKSVRHHSKNNLSVSPQYTYGNLDIVSDWEQYTIVVYNISGQALKWFENMSGNQSVNIAELQAGVYFIKLANNHLSQTVRVVKL